MTCSCSNKMVWVKGNDLTTIYKVTAIDQRTKQPLDNFDLFECSSIEAAYAVNASKKSVTEYDVIDTDKISIKWEGDKQRLGQYSVEIKGVWNGINWRMYNYKNYTFTIVDSNEAANIPPENFIADGSYLMEVEIGFLFGAQADWEQTDATKGDYIKHKPTSLSNFSEDSTHRTVTDFEKAAWNAKYSKPSGGIPSSDLNSSVQTSLGKADTALQNETDPTVPAWAKQPTKPSYTASEVGALPSTTVIPDELKDLSDDSTHRLVTDTEKSTWNGKQDALVSGTNIKTVNNQSLLGSGNITIQGGGGGGAIDSISVNGTPQTIDENKNVDITMPTKVSDLDNDSGFITGYTETDPTVPSWAKASSKPSYTASEVGAVPTTRTVNGKALSADITLSASDVNALPSSTVIPDAQIQSDWGQSTTTAKDYIKNKPTIPSVVDSLSSASTTAALSANQGKVLNESKQATIDASHKLSADLVDDANTTNKFVTSSEKSTWNGKADKVLVNNHGTSDTTYSVTPNILHIWGTVASLTLTLATPTDNTIVNEYMIEFTSGSTATTLSLPSSVEWAESCGALSVEASKTYQLSIVNNIGLWAAISNS